MSRALVLAHDASECEPLAAFAQALGLPFDIVTITGDCPQDLGAESIGSLMVGDPPPADSLCSGLRGFAANYSVVAGAATMFGKDYLPRLAALLDRPMVSDVVGVVDPKTFTRPMFAGNITADVRVDAEAFVVSVRATAFSNPVRSGQSAPMQVAFDPQGVTKRTGKSESAGGRPDLAQAKVVVSGGRPLKDAATFEKLIGGLADLLGGAAGATRAAVDSGIAPNDLQVGQTGKIVAPELYIAAGISGSTQHMAGMKESKVIVAINTDPEAPIFDIADYGLVQDLFVAIPELMSKIKP